MASKKRLKKGKQQDGQQDAQKAYAHPEALPNQAQGEGVGGEVNLSPEGENNITTNTPC